MKPFILQIDASYFGVGTLLIQSDDESLEHPCDILSCKPLPLEQDYWSMEKESFVIRPEIQVFHVHLLGRPLVHAQTDNCALQCIDWLKRDYLSSVTVELCSSAIPILS